MTEISECSKCGTQQYITNKTHRTCRACTFFKAHGMTTFEYESKKRKEYLEEAKSKPRKPIAHQSKKGRLSDKELSAVKKEVRETAFDNDEYYCKGCGKGIFGLQCSHTVSIAQSGTMKLLHGNLNLLCQECHEGWESFNIPRMVKLNCFLTDMEYLYTHNQVKFQKILFRLLDHCNNNLEDRASFKALQRIENIESQ